MVPIDTMQGLLGAAGFVPNDLERWARAWARVMPIVVIVPAFGLRAVPGPLRVALGACLALAIAPALPIGSGQGSWPLALTLALESLRGLPVAIVTASAFWVATMLGGLADNLRASREHSAMPTVEQQSTPLGVLLAMLLAVAFFQGGGAARIAGLAASTEPLAMQGALNLAHVLSTGIGLAIALAAPVLAVSMVVEVAGALVARAASPALIQPTLAPLKTLCILAVVALLLDRFVQSLLLATE